MSSQEIVDYVMNTPHNTNPAILKQMIDGVSGGGAKQIIATRDIRTSEWNINFTFDELKALYDNREVPDGWVWEIDSDPDPEQNMDSFVDRINGYRYISELDAFKLLTDCYNDNGLWFYPDGKVEYIEHNG